MQRRQIGGSLQSSRLGKSVRFPDTMLRKLTSMDEAFDPLLGPSRSARNVVPGEDTNPWRSSWGGADTGRARSELEPPSSHGISISPVEEFDYFEPFMQQYNLSEWGGVTGSTGQELGLGPGSQGSALQLTTKAAAETLMNSTTSDEFWPFNFSSWCQWNDTNCWNSTANATNGDGDVPQYKYWCLLLLIFPFFTVFGNILVVLSVVKERSLRTATNYFIVSLGVADLLVAVFVMPPAVYVEVVGKWTLNNALCDAWVAADVMACTASILNLTAISVDRFIAVTQPIKYSKHKNSKRFWVMLALTWVISFAIAAPIALGVNYSDDRVDEICTFYNSDFLIYSSMGSFYIPSIIMLFLYGKIYFVLRQRAKKFLARKAKTVDSKALQNVIENTATTAGAANLGHTETSLIENLHDRNNIYARTGARLSGAYSGSLTLSPNPMIHEEISTALHTTSSTHEDDEDDDEDDVKSPASDELKDHVIENDKSAEFMMSPVSDDNSNATRSGYAPPTTVEVETQFTSPMGTAPKAHENKSMLALPKKKFPGLSRNGSAKKKKSGGKKSVTRFNFHMRQSKKKKDKSSTRRERKATKTLAIVLGVFLLCWWPFFTINIMNAICIRYELKDTVAACDLHQMLFSFFVWLGYINSFLNPVIYTIFNLEFRKAFKKLLTEPCAK